MDSLARFPVADGLTIAAGKPIKEVEYVRIQDEPFFLVRRNPDAGAGTEIRGHEPYYAIRARDAAQMVVNARTLRLHDRDFSADSLLARVKEAIPDTAIVNTEMLTTYDSYYYSREGLAPLPVLRVKLDDPDRSLRIRYWHCGENQNNSVVQTGAGSTRFQDFTFTKQDDKQGGK